MDDLTKRRLFVVVVIIVLVSAGWIVAYNLTRPVEKPIPEQAITPPETNEPAPVKSIEGIDNLSRDGMSYRQTIEIRAGLEVFLASLNTSKLTVDVSSSKETFDEVNKYYIYRFSLLSEEKDIYYVDVLHISSTDALVRVYDSSNNLLFTPPTDEH